MVGGGRRLGTGDKAPPQLPPGRGGGGTSSVKLGTYLETIGLITPRFHDARLQNCTECPLF